MTDLTDILKDNQNIDMPKFRLWLTDLKNQADGSNGAVAALLNKYYPGARDHVPQGLVSVAIGTAGSGGTNGDYVIGLSGDNLTTDAQVNITVAGGVVTAASVRGPGFYVGDSLTIGSIDLSSIAGLTGAVVTPTGGELVRSGEYYLTDHTTDPLKVSLFKNAAGTATQVTADFLPASLGLAAQYAQDAQDALDALSLSPGQNIVQDSYNEIIATNPYADEFDHFNNSNPPVLFEGSLSGVSTPVITRPAGTNIIRKIDGSVTPLIPGATLYHSYDIYTDGSAASILIRWSDGSSQIGSSENYAASTGTAGVRTVSFSDTVPEGAVLWSAEVVSSASYKELIASFAAYGAPPVRLRAALQGGYLAAASSGKNLLPAPLLRDSPLSLGYTAATAWTASDADNPRGGGSITATGGADPALDIPLSVLGLVPGDRVTFRMIANWATGSTGNTCGINFRDSGGSLISGSSTTGVPAGGTTATGTQEIWRSLIIPDDAVTLRYSISGSGTRKIFAAALAQGNSPPDWTRGLISAAASLSQLDTLSASVNRPFPAKVGFAGDSFYDFAVNRGGLPTTYQYTNFSVVNWLRWHFGDRMLTDPAWAFAAGGTDTAYLLSTQLPLILAAGVDLLLVNDGTNDNGFVSADTTKANISAFIAQTRSAGISVIWNTILPQNAWSSTGKAFAAEVNRHLCSLAADPANRLYIADLYPAMVDFATAKVIDGHLVGDGVHPAIAGSVAMEGVIAPILDRLLAPAIDYPAYDPADFYNASSVPNGNMIANPIFSGTGGSKANGATGTVADNWQVRFGASGGSTMTAVASKGTAAGFTNLPTQVLTLGGTADSNTIVLEVLAAGNVAYTLPSGVAEGDILRAKLGLSWSGLTNIKGMYLRLSAKANGGTEYRQEDGAPGTIGGTGGPYSLGPMPSAREGVIMQPAPLTLPATPTNPRLQLIIAPLTAGEAVAGTIAFQQASIRKVG